MTRRKLTRLEGMLLGALVNMLPAGRPTDTDRCHVGYHPAAECPRCSKILAAFDLVDRVLKMQRKPDPKRRRKPSRRGTPGPALNRNVHDHKFDEPLEPSGRGGKRVGERRQADRQVHVINKESSKRDVELARSDLVGFFEDVLNKHHGGSF